MDQVIIKANTKHKDTGFQVEPDYSPKSISLSNKYNSMEFIPKSQCDLIKTRNPFEYEVRIASWLVEKKKSFFRDVL